MVWINGTERPIFSIQDRGLQYGDGLFETIAIENQRPVFLARHLQRLEEGCRRLAIPLPDWDLLCSEIDLACSQAESRGVLKIIVTAGVGGRGYRRPDAVETTRIISIYPFPDYPEAFAAQGIVARICSTPLGLNPALAGIKHLNRLEQVLARNEWSDPSVQEGIMLNTAGHVIEGITSNLFFVKDRALYTAPVNKAGVAGIARAVIKEIASVKHIDVREISYFPEALWSADEVFVCNSIIGIWPVNCLDQVALRTGPLTRKLQQWLNECKRENQNRDK